MGGPGSWGITGPWGYAVVGYQADIQLQKDYLENLTRLLADPSLKKALEKADIELLQVPKLEAVRIPGLPRGAQGYRLTIWSKDLVQALKKPGQKLEADAIVYWISTVADAGRVWVVTSGEPGLLARKTQAIVSPKPGETLADVAGFERLRSDKSVLAGALTLSGVGRAFTAARAAEQEPDDKSQALTWERLALRLPHRGETPIWLFLRAEENGPGAYYELQVNRAVFEDVTAFTMTLASELDAHF
jgi:hypothetical protein